MNKLSISPRLLIGMAALALVILLVGIYQSVDSTRRYNELAAMPVQSLIANAQTNQSSADIPAQIELNKHNADIARSHALRIIGGGAVLLGAAVFLYMRQPDPEDQTGGFNAGLGVVLRPAILERADLTRVVSEGNRLAVGRRAMGDHWERESIR